MRFSLSTVALSLVAFSLPAAVSAADPTTSFSTVTSTRTVYRITTETHTGTAPTSVQNITSIAKATTSSNVFPSGYIASTPGPKASGLPPFTGEAGKGVSLGTGAAAIVAVAGFLML